MSKAAPNLDTIQPKKGSKRSQSIIQQGIVISGEVKGEGNLTIEGEIDGDIELEGTCTIAESGHVEGNITAESIHIGGKLEGNASASETVEISSTGEVTGDVTVPNISIADGASVNGRVTVGVKKS